ncbi:MAG TPA: hypothetical protein VJR23_13225 [Candidatus Acidoferrales bacterium]|nr:hypothetical protein [Candidatus Acidoferrales bacterium]
MANFLKQSFPAIAGILLLIATISPPLCAQQANSSQAESFVAPVPAEISTAKTIFISNLGADPGGVEILLDAIKDPDALYNRFYAAMKSWGHFQIVGRPEDADLVITLSLVDHPTFAPRMNLVIFDEKSHFPLWTLSEPLQTAARKATWQKNFSTCINTLIGDFKRIASPEP